MSENQQKPPIAEKIPHTIHAHGTERIDQYHWLRDDNWQQFIKGDLSFSNQKVSENLQESEGCRNLILPGSPFSTVLVPSQGCIYSILPSKVYTLSMMYDQ